MKYLKSTEVVGVFKYLSGLTRITEKIALQNLWVDCDATLHYFQFQQKKADLTQATWIVRHSIDKIFNQLYLLLCLLELHKVADMHSFVKWHVHCFSSHIFVCFASEYFTNNHTWQHNSKLECPNSNPNIQFSPHFSTRARNFTLLLMLPFIQCLSFQPKLETLLSF